ncbi:MAG: YmdB family metallophosphoesterase [Candidatus Improbicoccus devescovinae]|nr:MAG: YmdB family metallophosphoesterase [Candidatus Improbicoccus devescovinae]
MKNTRVLFIGDIIGPIGCKFVKTKLNSFKKENSIDVVIANGENSAVDNGITIGSAEYLLSAGIDVITTGNHAFKKRSVYDYLNKSHNILRPANFPENTTPGKGVLEFELNNIKFCVINLMGVHYLEPLRCPFETIDKILEKFNNYLIKIVDFHAELTSEKRAFGFFVDGRISAVLGTHTHVQTADAQILPGGTGYITDVGMVGAIDSVLGVKKEISIKRMKEKIPLKFEHDSNGRYKMDCVILDIDNSTGKTVFIKNFSLV